MSLLFQQDLEHIWQQAPHCLSDLTDARLFITGGTGFFGCWLLESLYFARNTLQIPIEAVVLTRNPAAFALKLPHLAHADGFSFHQGDVQDFVFPQGRFTHVIHAATEANAALNREQPLVMLDTIIKGTRRVLEFAVHAQASKFLLTSSGAIYGKQPNTLTHIPETYQSMSDPLSSTAAYGMGKLLAEHLCVLFSKQYALQTKIARCFAFVGPYLPLDTRFAIGNFIGNALQGKTIHVQGDGSPFRSYLYAADLMIWLFTILCLGQTGTAYNVGSEHDINIADLAALISKQVNPYVPVHIANTLQPGALAERYVPSTTRAREELKLSEHIALQDAIQRTLRWHSRCVN